MITLGYLQKQLPSSQSNELKPSGQETGAMFSSFSPYKSQFALGNMYKTDFSFEPSKNESTLSETPVIQARK